ncbi:MAG: single-stranded-DNA-specific exonuclease RecJ [Bacteroidota bacterium]|nr:single-stranded-DNA-specific exonuclease RecJ [Bacteroidota bacterium]
MLLFTNSGDKALSPFKEYRWKVAEPPDLELIKKLSEELTIAPSLAAVLINRKVDDFEKARRYFRPTEEQLHDPFLLDGMHVAVERILAARISNEKMLVYGDYDVDGTNGASMLYLFFREIGCNVSYYIPDRIKEGYGISHAGIDQAKRTGISLMVAVDCGITAVEQVEYARSLGVDVIICDHHEPGNTIPNAVAGLDPIKPASQYPFKFLCGCGVGFKLIQAIARTIGDEISVSKYLDFVAIATTADIVPLVEENRVFVKLGLELINKNPRSGIHALLQSAGLEVGSIATGQIVFVMAPRINAVGRLGNAMRAVDLLVSESFSKAVEYARVLEQENQTRRKIDEDVFLHAQQLVEEYLDVDSDGAIILHQEQWHPGVIGIVASRIVEKYYRPAIMLTTVDGVVKGSARSVAGFNIYQALKRCEGKLLQFGGHKYAAGLTVDPERLEEFKEAFNAVAKELLTDDLRTPEIAIDAEIDLAELTPKYLRILKQFAPFGPKNMRPMFVAHDVELVGTPRIVGKNHLRFKIRKNGTTFDCIGFGLGDLLPRLNGTPPETQKDPGTQNGGRKDLSIVFSVDENDYTGVQLPQLKIKDLK